MTIARLLAAAKEIAKQTPEKPDYWSSCGQCDHNISDMQDILASLPADMGEQEYVVVKRESIEDALAWMSNWIPDPEPYEEYAKCRDELRACLDQHKGGV